MQYLKFDESRPFDMVLLGRAAIDLNPSDYYQPLPQCTTFKKYLGGSPANIAVGLARLGKKIGFIAKVSDDQFGDFIYERFGEEGIDTSHVTRCTGGQKLGLTFTEILSEHESSILMYRNDIADLQLTVDDVDEDYIRNSKALLISGTALAESPSREAALKAAILAEKTNTPLIFDIDYRSYNWKNAQETAIYDSMVACRSSVILGSREEFNLTESLIRPGMTDQESASYWHGQKARVVVIKHGREGSSAYTCDGNHYTIKPFPIKALKSFGGGDGYASSFLRGLLDGWEIPDCLEFGSASASLLVASHGCSEFMPTDAMTREYIASCKAEYGDMVARG
ncbi:5-dehydro-2-deoxygluconokinase [Marasmitruncus massiliensis]|uniref:5-dehydro-2-deoxygluconokinase n=1 Tax=Marasmitruncus massiliensis TaxID=1944642 RepID=UPI000C7A3B76|nr:5-dehydro-2-deoxygluconokinase [Marasmitruncus massiliensis]